MSWIIESSILVCSSSSSHAPTFRVHIKCAWSAADRIRTGPVGPRCRRSDRGPVHGPHSETAFSDLASVSGQSRSRHRSLRHLHSSHIYRWIATRRHRARWNRRRKARSSPLAKSVDCITDTRVLRDRRHWLAGLVFCYRSACDGETARFAWDPRLLRGHFPGCHSIRRVSSRLVQSPDGVIGKDRRQ